MFVKRTKACDSSIIDVLDHVLLKGVVIDVGPLVATDLLTSRPLTQLRDRRAPLRGLGRDGDIARADSLLREP